MDDTTTLLAKKINYEAIAEVHKPLDPVQVIIKNNKKLSDLPSEIESHLKQLSIRYPSHIDFYYKFNYTEPSNGCYSAWFDLYGRRV